MTTPSTRIFALVLGFFLLAPAWAGDTTSKIVFVSTDSITVGKKHPKTYKITPATAITVNGARAAVAALKQDMEATIVATDTTATSIVATEKPAKKKPK